jgi:hypothetical protein
MRSSTCALGLQEERDNTGESLAPCVMTGETCQIWTGAAHCSSLNSEPCPHHLWLEVGQVVSLPVSGRRARSISWATSGLQFTTTMAIWRRDPGRSGLVENATRRPNRCTLGTRQPLSASSPPILQVTRPFPTLAQLRLRLSWR